MPPWLVKSALHHGFALSGRPQRWNSWFQRHVTRSTDVTGGALAEKLGQAAVHTENWWSRRPEGSVPTALEIGSGWLPVVPLALYACGAGTIWTLDVAPLLEPGRVLGVARGMVDLAASGNLRSVLPRARPDRLARLEALHRDSRGSSAAELLRRLDIKVIIGDARDTGLETGSVDLVVSNNTLEHVPGAVLGPMLDELHRVLSPVGMMSHYIDMRDHFARFDRRITVYNYLRYSDRWWGFLGSPVEYQNRLRLPDYRRALERAGFTVCQERNEAGELDQLLSVPIATPFRSMAIEDLAVVGSWVVAEPRAALDQTVR